YGHKGNNIVLLLEFWGEIWATGVSLDRAYLFGSKITRDFLEIESSFRNIMLIIYYISKNNGRSNMITINPLDVLSEKAYANHHYNSNISANKFIKITGQSLKLTGQKVVASQTTVVYYEARIGIESFCCMISTTSIFLIYSLDTGHKGLQVFL
ncbi:hypothetical protein ACJX0J_010890, partial [Zea mays]